MTIFKIKTDKQTEESGKTITLALKTVASRPCFCGECPKEHIALVGTDATGSKKIIAVFKEDRLVLSQYAQLDGLKTDDNGTVAVESGDGEKFIRENSSSPEKENPSINGVEFWLEKDSDGDIRIIAKNKKGNREVLGWFNKRSFAHNNKISLYFARMSGNSIEEISWDSHHKITHN